MATSYLGEIRIFGFNFPPKGWALANGQLLPINQNQALFAILGTFYGGNGTTTFALPNLQGSSPLHVSSNYPLGQVGGEPTHTLNIEEIPLHTHVPMAQASAGNQSNPVNNVWAAAGDAYNSKSNETMNPAAIANAGGSQPHSNMPPYLVLTFAIALQGIFPSRN
jgi:microcystin-dependent protein